MLIIGFPTASLAMNNDTTAQRTAEAIQWERCM